MKERERARERVLKAINLSCVGEGVSQEERTSFFLFFSFFFKPVRGTNRAHHELYLYLGHGDLWVSELPACLPEIDGYL